MKMVGRAACGQNRLQWTKDCERVLRSEKSEHMREHKKKKKKKKKHSLRKSVADNIPRTIHLEVSVLCCLYLIYGRWASTC